MTITVNDAREEYTASAGQTVFNYTFKIFESTDLNVYITPTGQVANDLTDITTAYTVTNVGAAGGGTIVLTVGATLNDLVTIVSNIPSSRTTDYQSNGDFLPATVNDDFDRVISIVKKIEDTTNRAVVTAQSQQGPKPLSLPQPVPGKILRWNGSSDGLENVSPSDVPLDTVLTQDLAITKATIAAMTADVDITAGQFINVEDYATGNNSGVLFFKATEGAASAPDGGSQIDHDTLGIHFLQNFNTSQVTVKQFGARGDGISDDTAAIQASLDSSYLSILIPKGTYVTSSTLDLTKSFQSFYGVDQNQWSAVIKPTAAVTKVIAMNGTTSIGHFTVEGVNTTNATGLMIGESVLSNVVKAEDVLLQNFTGASAIGVYVREVVGLDFYNVRVIDSELGMRIQGTTGSLGTYMNFTNCAFRAGETGLKIVRGYGIAFNNCLFEDNTLEGVRIDTLDRVERVTFRNCWFERNFQSSATDYQVVVDGTNPGAVTEDINFDKNFFYVSNVSKTAHFIKVTPVRWSGNTHQSTAATVLFDTNSTGWVSEQVNSFASGAIVDSTGLVGELATTSSGTWTATLISSGNITGTPTFANGTYSKTGKQVTLWGSWTVDVTSATVDTFVQMGGIPFNTETAASFQVGACNLTLNTYSIGAVKDPSGANSDRLISGISAAQVVTNGSQLMNFTVTYETAS